MSRHEKLAALDLVERALKDQLDRMARDLSLELMRRQVPYRVEIEGHFVVIDTRLDPRLPDPPQEDVFG